MAIDRDPIRDFIMYEILEEEEEQERRRKEAEQERRPDTYMSAIGEEKNEDGKRLEL